MSRMSRIIRATRDNKITQKEGIRYLVLHKKLMGNNPFVEVENTPEWNEFQKLTNKIK